MYMLWNQHGKQWKTKHFDASVHLSEGFLSMFGLGFDFSHTDWLTVQRLKHNVVLDINILWARFTIFLDWGGKPKWDALVKKIREDRDNGIYIYK